MELRIGQGFDAHRFAKGRKLILGGVKIAHDQGLLGHSDADVLMHAIADALLGAAGWGDLGSWFPDDDARWKDAPSHLLLEEIAKKLAHEGWRIAHVDATVLAERPRLAPYREAMQRNIAKALSLPPACVHVKATTTEGMGFIGRAEGMAALAVALLVRKGGGDG